MSCYYSITRILSKPLLTPNSVLNEEYGRFIGLQLSFEVKTRYKGDFSEKKKNNISQAFNLFISSGYHPDNFLSSVYDTIPSSYIIMSGQDMNANFGIRNTHLQ